MTIPYVLFNFKEGWFLIAFGPAPMFLVLVMFKSRKSGTTFSEFLCASLFTDDLSNEPNISRIYLNGLGQYL